MFSFKLSKIWFLAMAGLVAILIYSCDNTTTTDTVDTDDTTYTTTTDTCTCEDDWFPHAQTPPPLEGANSPFAQANTTNCMFHRWSWQKFLYLTKPGSNGKALFQEELIMVTHEMIPNDSIMAFNQAGGGAVLTSNANFNTGNISDTIFYVIYVNDTMHKASQNFAQQLIADTSQLNNTYTFPVGALELKTAWVKVDALEAGTEQNYYTSEFIMQENGVLTTFALIGMHVVGRVENHPEFIWATFEYNGMAPYFDWDNTTATSDAPVISANEKLLFAQNDTATYQDISWTSTTAQTPENVFGVYKYGVPRVAGGNYMQNLSQNGQENYDNIAKINDCVASKLQDLWNNYAYQGSIWMNMDGLTPQQQADTIVAIGNIGDVDTGSLARGSLACYNITMETYEQVAANKPMHTLTSGDLQSCLFCHEPVVKIADLSPNLISSPLYISHVFGDYLQHEAGLPISQIKKNRIERHLNMLKRRGIN